MENLQTVCITVNRDYKKRMVSSSSSNAGINLAMVLYCDHIPSVTNSGRFTGCRRLCTPLIVLFAFQCPVSAFTLETNKLS